MIFVPVREDDCAHAAGTLREIAHVRQDEIDAEMLVARKREASVDDYGLAFGLVDGHVLADLAEAAERDDPRRSGHQRSLAPGPG